MVASAIIFKELKELIDAKKPYVLIDVREDDELQYGVIPTAHHLPLGELEDALAMPPQSFKTRFHFPKMSKKDLVVFYCRTGGRSSQATSFALSQGYQAKNLTGGIWTWSTIDPRVKRYGPEPQQ